MCCCSIFSTLLMFLAKKYFSRAYKIFQVKGEFFQELPNLTFFSEQQRLSYTSKALLFSFRPAAFRIFFFLDLTLYKEWQIASLRATVDAAISRCTRSMWTLGHGQTHNNAPAGKGKVIGPDSKCQPMGQIICVMMRNQLAVWGGVCGRVFVCVCVTHGHSLPVPWVHWID